MSRVLAIAAVDLRRLVRDRVNLFFVFVLPLVLILVLGSAFANFEPRIGVVAGDDGVSASELVQAIEGIDGAEVSRIDDVDDGLRALRRDDLEAVVVVPAGFDAALRGEGTVVVDYLATPGSGGFEVRGLVDAVVAEFGARVAAARFVEQQAVASFDDGLALADELGTATTGVDVEVVGPDLGPVEAFDGRGFLAAQQLVLFVFVTSLAASTALIEMRRIGVARRMVATPASVSEVVAGLALGRFAIAALQGLFIVVAAGLLFGVDWGNLPASLALVVAFALVGTGAALAVGSAFSNESQAGSIGIFAALGLAAFGGSMVPLEVFSDGLRRAAHVTPHAWANDGFSQVIRDGAGIGGVIDEIAVLVLYAAVLLGFAVVLLRRRLLA